MVIIVKIIYLFALIFNTKLLYLQSRLLLLFNYIYLNTKMKRMFFDNF